MSIFEFFTFKTSSEIGNRKVPAPAALPVKASRELDQFRQRMIASLKWEMDVVNGFYDRLQEIFDASGVGKALHNQVATKMDITRKDSTIYVKFGWKVDGGVLILEGESQGYVVPEVLPNDWNDWTKDTSKWTAEHHFKVAYAGDNGDTFNSSLDVPVALELKKSVLPTWFVEKLIPLV